MRDVRVLLVGGTSNVGKSTVSLVLARRLGFEYLSTDRLARHPGRPWPTPDHPVPEHVIDHYTTRTADELVTSLLDHYERLWPRIEELITAHAAASGTGLVLEGSGLWPTYVAGLTAPNTVAVWLTADTAVLRARVRRAGRYETATDDEKHLMDKFLARTEGYQALMLNHINALGLARIDAGDGRSVPELASAVRETAIDQETVGQSAHPR